MKKMLELPDSVFRKAKTAAAERGQTLVEYITEALRDKLDAGAGRMIAAEPPWMQGFGTLKHLHKETVRVQGVIDDTFEVIESADRR